MADLDLCILGPLRVRIDGQERTVRGTHRRAILALLALEPGVPMDRDRLIEQVWGLDPPATARSSLRVHITNLRRDLGDADLVATTDHGYCLDVPGDAVDAHRFLQLARSGRQSLADARHADAVGELSRAADLWHDPVLPDLGSLDAATPHRTHLDRVHDELLVDLAEARLHADPGSPDVTALEALVDQQPFDERPWALLMTALYRSGRQADALRAYQRARDLLRDEMGLEPGVALTDLEARILAQDPQLDVQVTATVDLPAFPTSYVGRAAETVEVTNLLDRHRLVTITGMGGAGKTRLAVEAARTVVDRYPGGVVFVPFERLGDPALIPTVLGDRLDVGADDVDAIAASIADRRLLLVLDNAEQVVDDLADIIDHLVRTCPNLRLLVTSRLPLGLTGEAVWAIPPLATPDDLDGAADSDVVASDAVALFVDRARQYRPELDLDRSTVRTMAKICRHLAGLPLAIELAAAQSRVRSLEEIAAQLLAGTAALASPDRDRPERHWDLHASVQWTLDLLDDGHRVLFRRLSVFHDPIDLDGIEDVCDPPTADEATLDSLVSDLVEASLVLADVTGPRATFLLLPPVRQVAADNLARSEGSSDVDDRHLRHVSALVAAAAAAVGGPQEASTFEQLDARSRDVRAALLHAREADAAAFVQLCIDLGPYWIRRRFHRDARRWVQHAIQVCDPADAGVYATLLHTAGALAFDDADLDEAEALLGRALAIRRERDDTHGQALTLNNLAGVASDAGDHDVARRRWQEGAALFEAAGHDHAVAATRCNLGILADKLGHLGEADEHLATALEATRRSGSRALEAIVLERRGYVAAQQGDLDGARAFARAAHQIHDRDSHTAERARSNWNLAMSELALGDTTAARQLVTDAADMVTRAQALDAWWVSGLIETAACLLAQFDQHRLAARLLGAAVTNRQRQGHPDSQFTMIDLSRVRRDLSAALGMSTYRTEWTVGSALTAADALEDILAHLAGERSVA